MMQKSHLTRLAGFSRTLAALPLVAACWLICLLPAQAAQQVLQGHVPSVTKRLKSIGRLESNRRLELAIGLPLRNREKLTNLLEELYQPLHPNFRHYLSANEFASSFGPTEADYQAVMNFAKSHGLIVKHTHANRTLLNVSGQVSDIEKAFHVKMKVYPHPTEARNFYAPDVEPSLDLDTPVLAISGLDSYVRPRPQMRPLVRPLGGGGGGGGGGTGGSGSGGLFLGYDFRNAYAPGVALDGTGQTLGLFELTGYDPEDITDYEDEAGISPYVPLQNIYIDGFDGDDTNIDYAIECTGDIQMAAAMAPGLSGILVYEGPTPLYEAPLDTNYVQYESTTAQINDVLNRMATDDLAQQLSCSYEMDINLSTVQIFQQYAAQGQSFFQGSGDLGAYVGPIDEPADDPYITVVGGTTLKTSSAGGPWKSDVVWLTPASDDPLFGYSPEAASGGGFSLAYAMPSWQQDISMSANQGSTTMRNLPDVALIANNVDLVWGNDYIGESFDFSAAGTSLATPLWAGFMALVNQQAAANGQPPVGFANPALYAIGKSTKYSACFHDVTSGNNFTPTSPSKYAAVAGYDLCTGWGTMNGSNLIPALLSPPSESLLVTSPLGFTSFGPSGGPFTVTSQMFILTNIGSSPLNWNLVNTSSWLNAVRTYVPLTYGTLNPGGAINRVTVSLNSASSNFLIGNYSGNISFVNSTDGTIQNRQFDLYVGNGGFETGDFSDWKLVADTNQTFVLAGDDTNVGGTNALDGEADGLFVHSGIYGAYLGQYPTDGYLLQTVTTTPGQYYLLSFWLTCVPYQGSTTPNDFTASWNGVTLYSETNADAFGWTNMQYVVPATASVTTLEFAFNNVPGAFGLDDVSIGPLPAPVLQAVAMTNGYVTLSWSSVSNLSYQIQSAPAFQTTGWTNVGGRVTGTGSIMSVSESLGSPAQQYYRVSIVMP